jgi:hypothetical protein
MRRIELGGATWLDAPVFGFVRQPPVTVGELAEALGATVADLVPNGMYGMGSIPLTPRLSETVEGVSADYAWDRYHEHPIGSVDALAGRRLSRYAARFASGRAACEAELRSGHGPAVPVAGRRRYGPFFVDAGSGGGGGGGGAERFVLEWYAAMPDWAVPVDAAVRARAVEELAAAVALAETEPELAAAVAAVPPVDGIEVTGARLTFRPPMPAVELAGALGRPDAVGRTVDVHMSSWVLAVPAGEHTGSLRLGRWRVDARLVDGASGGDVPGIWAPASRVAHLTGGDTVRTVEFLTVD